MILLKEGILHQLRLVVSPFFYRVLDITGGAGFLPSTVIKVKLNQAYSKDSWNLKQPRVVMVSCHHSGWILFLFGFLFATGAAEMPKLAVKNQTDFDL